MSDVVIRSVLKNLTGFVLLGFAVTASANLPDVVCAEEKPQKLPCYVESTGLPLRVLVKPQSNVYLEKDETGVQIRPNVPAFEVFYTFEMDDVSYDNNFNATGWFRVGAAFDTPDGWMRADDVIPWRQALALAFTNPGPSERKPVVMFDTDESLDYLLEDIESNVTTAEDFYNRVLSSEIPEGVVSREGNAWVNIDQTFYLMPILDHMDLSTMRGDGDLRGVQLAALTNAPRSEQSIACDIRNSDYDECMEKQSGKSAALLRMDAIFVIDMTASMGPYIDAVRNAIRETSQRLSEDFVSSDAELRFGLVGYRDVVELSPGIEFVSRNFTPDLLDVSEFAKLLSENNTSEGNDPIVQESFVGSGDFPEEVFAGLETAINSNWSPDAPRLIILVGDASSHPINHPKNTTGLDEKSIREMADHNSVYIASIYIGSQESPDYVVAREQFETVSTGDGDANIAFAEVSSTSGDSLEGSLRDVIDKVTGFIDTGNFTTIMSDSADESDSAGQAILTAVRAAFVDYIGKEAQPPSNIVAWALDRDPTDFSKKAFDIKVVLGRKDMEELQDLLQGLIETLNVGSSSSSFVFGQVQGNGINLRKIVY